VESKYLTGKVRDVIEPVGNKYQNPGPTPNIRGIEPNTNSHMGVDVTVPTNEVLPASRTKDYPEFVPCEPFRTYGG
jgi:hypothetical protein